MGVRKSPEGAADARILLDRALESEKGIRVPFESSGKAQNMRQRCHAVIRRARLDSYKIYEESHRLYGVTPYDTIAIHRENKAGTRYPGPPRTRKDAPMDDGNYLVFVKLDRMEFDVEELI